MSQTENQEESIEDIKRHVKQHVIIAVGLAIGTATAIAISLMHFSNPGFKIALCISIACVQAFFIAGFFMHLLSEKKLIYSFLVFTAVFFIVQMALTVLSHTPDNVIHITQNVP